VSEGDLRVYICSMSKIQRKDIRARKGHLGEVGGQKVNAYSKKAHRIFYRVI